MTATYNTTSPTDRDRLRLKIGDTNTSHPIFEDEELDMILADDSEVLLAAASACRIIAASASRQAVALSLPGVTISKTSIPDKFLAMADAFEKQAETGATADTANWYTNDAAFYDAITGRASVDLDTPSTE